MLTRQKTELIIRAYLPVIAWAGLIFFLSSRQTLPSPSDEFINFLLKKTAHMFVYGVLYLLVNRAFMLTHHVAQKYRLVTALVLTMLYAGSDELHQSFVANRTATFRDVGYDFLGAGIAILWSLRLI